MKRYYKIIIDWVWLLLWWLALFWLMLVFKWNSCPSPDSQVMEAIQEIQQWQQYLIDKGNAENQH